MIIIKVGINLSIKVNTKLVYNLLLYRHIDNL